MVSAMRSETRWLLAVLLLGLLVRGCVCFGNLSRYSADPDAYRAIAIALDTSGTYGLEGADGTVHATAYRPPLYPYLLSWFATDGKLSNGSVAALHTLLGGLSVLLVFMTARRLLVEHRRPLILSAVAAVLVAIDPILVLQSSQVMTETLATALVCAVMWSWCGDESPAPRWQRPLLLGLWLALAFLCRPTFLVWSVLIAAGFAWPGKPAQRPRGIPASLTVALAVAATVCGWTWRNQQLLGQPVWATTHGGYTLLLANNDSFYDYLNSAGGRTAWDPEAFFRAYSHRYEDDPSTAEFWRRDWSDTAALTPHVSEAEDDRIAYAAAVATIRRRPVDFMKSCAARLGRLWTPLPHQTGDRSRWEVAAIGGYYVLIYAAVLIGLGRLGKAALGRRWWPVWALAIALSGVHAVYWSNLRMRAPLVPGLAILAAAAFGRRDHIPSAESPAVERACLDSEQWTPDADRP